MPPCSHCGASIAEATGVCPACGTAPSAPSSDFVDIDLVGQTVDGKYHVDAPIDASGRVATYRARQVDSGATVVLKVLRGRWVVVDPATVDRFRREVQAVANLDHSGIAKMYDAGFSADGLLYSASELVAGEPLRALMDRSGALAVDDAVAIVRQVAAALDEAHRRDVVHRNLKPENVFVDITGGAPAVKVLDFGLTTLRSVALVARGPRRRNGVETSYVSPEQERGEEPDALSDVYCLGLLAYEMLAGAPFGTPSARALPATLDPVVRRALRPRREDRPPCASAFAYLLETAASGAFAAPAADATPATQAASPVRRSRLAPALVAAAAVVIVLGFSAAALAFHFVPSEAKQAILAEVRRGNLAKASGTSAYDLFQSYKNGSLDADEKAEIAATATVALESRGEEILSRLRENSRESEDDWEEAIRLYGWLNELRPSPSNEAHLRFAEGRLSFMRKDYEAACSQLERAVAASPSWSLALNSLGRTKARLGDRAGAIECYRRAAEADPEWIYPWLNLAVASIGAQDYATAEEALRRGLAIYPERATTRYALGRTLERTGRACDALAEYRIALERAGAKGERPAFNAEALAKRIDRLAARVRCS